MSQPSLTGAVLLSPYCDIFGNPDKDARFLGNQAQLTPTTRWRCRNRSVGRFRGECSHGHRSQIFRPCEGHLLQYRTSITYCPRCNTEPPGHKCRVILSEIS